MQLEVLSRPGEGAAGKTPLLFMHGAYVGAWCWEVHFLDSRQRRRSRTGSR